MNHAEESSDHPAGHLQINEDHISMERAFKEMQEKEKELSKRTEMLENIMQSLARLLPVQSPQPATSTPAGTTGPVFSFPSPSPSDATIHRPSSSPGYPKSYLRDVLELIPKYDGHNIPVWQFARACKRALESVPSVEEGLFVKMLRNKLVNHAYLAVEDEVHPTVEKFLDCLKRVFGPGRSSNYYRGQLSMAYKKQNEHVLDFIGRIKDLKSAIIEGDQTNLGRSLSADEVASIESFALDSFFEGLPREYRIELRAEGYSSLADACAKTLVIHKRLEREELRYKMVRTPRDGVPQANQTRIHSRDPSATTVDPSDPSLAANVKICGYCKKIGHLLSECRTRRYRENSYNNPNYKGNINNNSQIHSNVNNVRNLALDKTGNGPEVSAKGASRGLGKIQPAYFVDETLVPSTSSAETTEMFPPSSSNPLPSYGILPS